MEQRGDRCRVAVGSLLLWTSAAELRPVEAGRIRKSRGTVRDGRGEASAPRVRRVDLHGHTAEQARQAVLDAVDRAIVDGIATLELVHGRGTGRVKAIVLQVLTTLTVVRQVRPHASNPGVTIAHL